MHAVVSVDGFIADKGDEVGPLFDWYFNGEAEIVDGGQFKVSDVSIGYVRPMWERIGVTVVGRHLFDLTNGWEGTPPAGDVGGQALALGLVDEVAMDVVAVVFGSGKHYFGSVDAQHLLEDPDVVIQGRRVLDLRYPVRR
jgi:hypothetical protein